MKKPTNLLKVGNLLFDLSPKAGSNTVMSCILYSKKLKSTSDKDKRSYWHYFRKNSVNSTSPNQIAIKVTRNPYNRVVSAYAHYSTASRRKDISFTQWLVKTEKIHALYDEKSNFYSENLGEIKSLFPEINIRQYEMLFLQTNADDLSFDHIIKLENFNSEIKNINTLYGTSFQTIKRHQNTRAKSAHTKNIDYPNAKFATFATMPKDYSVFYNEQTIDLVNKIYKDDFENFGYNYKS